MSGPRRVHRRISANDIEKSLVKLASSTEEGEFYSVMLAFWRYLLNERPAVADWTRRQVETLVNQFPGIAEASAFGLLWKVLSFATNDMRAVEDMFLHGAVYVKDSDPHVARVTGKIYI